VSRRQRTAPAAGEIVLAETASPVATDCTVHDRKRPKTQDPTTLVRRRVTTDGTISNRYDPRRVGNATSDSKVCRRAPIGTHVVIHNAVDDRQRGSSLIAVVVNTGASGEKLPLILLLIIVNVAFPLEPSL
jgi:hypothetical protein